MYGGGFLAVFCAVIKWETLLVQHTSVCRCEVAILSVYLYAGCFYVSPTVCTPLRVE